MMDLGIIVLDDGYSRAKVKSKRYESTTFYARRLGIAWISAARMENDAGCVLLVELEHSA